MTKAEKQKYEQMRTIAYWSGYDGLEVKKFEHGFEDYCIVVANTFGGKPRSVHKLKIHYDTHPNIRLNGRRWYFDECIRNGI